MEQSLPRRNARLAAALALLAIAAPGQAQDYFSRGADKSTAILGAPSQLAAIMAAQSGGAAAVAVAIPAPFMVRHPLLTVPIHSAPEAAAPDVAAPDVAAPDVIASPTSPDVFNSVALPIGASPLDHRWNRVAKAKVGGAAARFAAALDGQGARARIEAVNAYVNRSVTFTNDSRQFGVADRWSAANETLARGRGDCEDFALAKLAMLRRAGFADRDLYFVVLKDVARRADHAVLVVRSNGRFLVLDNGTDRLRDSAELVDYRPVLTFTAGQRFTHGYRRSLPSVVYAGYDASPGPARQRFASNAGMPSSPFASR